MRDVDRYQRKTSSIGLCLKHFPGIGGAVTNTDDGPATIERSAEQIRSEDLLPFRSAIEAGVPLVMAGHALYPALDGERIASQSQPIVHGLLRDELGFDGVIITDSTEAAAVQAVTDVREADVGSILGFGYAPYAGGTLSYIDMMGTKKFVELCQRLEQKYGARFAPNKLLIEMAAKGESFYSRFAPKRQKAAA